MVQIHIGLRLNPHFLLLRINIVASLNVPKTPVFTAEGAHAQHINPEQQLRRLVMSCLLWESGFYTDGKTIAQAIATIIPRVDARQCAQIAWEARNQHNLRHVGLHIVREMARLPQHKRYVSRTLQNIIQRPDELTEFLAIYWADKRQPLSAKVKQGLAYAFRKFGAYELAKYNRTDKAIKLRDVLFLCHAKPKDAEQAELWKNLIDSKLAPADTWEVALSAGADKAATFRRLMGERKLGAMAFLRNLRLMTESNIEPEELVKYGLTLNTNKVLPFRYIAAAKTNPTLEPLLEVMLFDSIAKRTPLLGKTVLLIDVSGSMDWALSTKSEMRRIDAACGLAMIIRQLSTDCAIYSFSNFIQEVPPRRGFALRDAIVNSQEHSGTRLGYALNWLHTHRPIFDRLIVITDEQTQDQIPVAIYPKSYLLNVGVERNGVGYGSYVHIDGFSASTVEWLQAYEAANTLRSNTNV